MLALLFLGRDYLLEALANHLVFKSDDVRPATHHVTMQTSGFATEDGINLRADIYRPQELGKTPTILIRLPVTDTFYNRLRIGMIGRYWAGRGYAVVVQGTRGRYKSGGRFYPLKNERSDGLQTLAWLKTLPWYDGRLVMWGGSAFGYTQWAVSDQPEVDAYFIQIASTDFHRMFYPGGAFALESALNWAITSRGDKDREVKLADLERGVWALPISKADNLAIGDTDFYNDWVSNPERDAYWKGIDGERRAENLQAPVLLLGGWFDPFLAGQLDDYEAITRSAKLQVAQGTKLIIGPWGHARELDLPGQARPVPYRSESVMQAIPWFDSRLDIAAENVPKVRLYVMGINRWRHENEWPLARTRYTPLFLSNRELAIKPPLTETVQAYRYDPTHPVPTRGGAMLSRRSGMMKQNDIEQRSDILTYSTSPLRDDTEVTGPIKLILYVATDAASADFTAKLVDVHPDGSAYNLSEGILRRQYDLTSQQPTRIEIELSPTANVFLKGHRIRLEVSSSNFPRYDRNLNSGQQKVFVGFKYPSQLILPLIAQNRT
ncbi:Cocaine esterase [Asticcacaulis sp. MM231]